MSEDLKQAMRVGMRRLAAGVCVVSTQKDGQRYAMTASSVTSLSDDPASLLVCVHQDASLQAVMTYGQPFVVNVLAHSQQQISNLCATKELGEERFDMGAWAVDYNQLPFLEDAQASFFCTVDNEDYHYGTHQIVIGRLERVLVADAPIEPLVYVDAGYRQLS